jgi:hypothetical protein
MNKTTVVHCKRAPYEVYIGRPSKWGNPFEIGKNGTRQQVIEKYRAWILSQPQLIAALGELRGKVLGCWCKPQPCHGDVLTELADAPPAAPDPQPPRPKTRGELRDLLRKGVACEVVSDNTEITATLIRGWLGFYAFTTRPSANAGWTLFTPTGDPT